MLDFLVNIKLGNSPIFKMGRVGLLMFKSTFWFAKTTIPSTHILRDLKVFEDSITRLILMEFLFACLLGLPNSK
jgi:hypothetical protein